MICRVCDSVKLEPVVDLGSQPWCNNFLKKSELGQEPFYPLRVQHLSCYASVVTVVYHSVLLYPCSPTKIAPNS